MCDPKRPRANTALSGVSTESILESISDGVFTVDSSWRITSFNRAAEAITGTSRHEAIGRRCADVFRASMCESECALLHTIKTGQPIVNKAAFIVDAAGRRVPISVSTALLRDSHGDVEGGAETFRDLTIVEELREKLKGRYRVGDIFSRSPAMGRVLELIPRVADSEATVLLQGETGTGKELVARAIHQLSPRQNRPFVAVNCGALPDTLLESELFGYEAGAFTGATKNKAGRFALAEGGTLFLDEIGEVSPALQVRLLRVLQDKTYDPLGATRTRRANVRIITATNRDLAARVDEGEFRQDLYYRVKVVGIELPPLRKRREDIPLLVEHFIRVFNASQSKGVVGVSPEVLAVLLAHDYPGNVRELENILEYAFVLCHEGQLALEHLPAEIVPVTVPLGNKRKLQDVARALEAQTIEEALRRNGHNRLAAARELGIHKTTLYRKIKALGIQLATRDGRTKTSSDDQ
ncbi:MAG: sigma 54-interacting transcriptional regulator [Proteobacteria bacterium]|nr:sigma 54-interacting transcriptional regulator [Pseudomonadota bacterium]